MTQPLDLDAIEQRANATPGPWALHDALDGDGYPGHLWVVETPDGTPGDNAVVISIGDKATGEFIAAARTDVPLLLAELGRVRAELATANAAIDRTTAQMQTYSAAGSGGVNPRQVINLLSLTWPDGNYEAPASPSV